MKSKGKQKKLLCIVGSLDAGGAETFLMKLYRNLDRSKYQMDFFCMTLDKGFYEDEIEDLGGKVFHSIPKSENLMKAAITLTRVIRDHEYKYVMRVSQHSLATFDLIVAKLAGAKVLIQRSSNTNTNGKIGKILHSIFRILPIIVPDIKLAPSTEAAQYTFGKKSIRVGKVTLIKNAIDIKEFMFNPIIRNKVRKEMKIDGKLVVGNIGRFSNQKNHSFLLDIFKEIYLQNSNSVLVLVGKGELEKSIKEKITSLDLSENVIFTGVRSDIPNILMAMDVFVFPSIYEGMPNTVIEAQATGLPCLISDEITKEAQITDMVQFLPLTLSADNWAEAAQNINKAGNKIDRKSINKKLYENGYDIKSVTSRFEKLIFTN